MAEPMRIRANLSGNETTVRVLMNHIMESGFRKNSEGKMIPPHFIQTVEATYNGRPVLKALWGGAVSQNPFFSFKFQGGAKGGKVSIKWVDTKGDSRLDEAVIQ